MQMNNVAGKELRSLMSEGVGKASDPETQLRQFMAKHTAPEKKDPTTSNTSPARGTRKPDTAKPGTLRDPQAQTTQTTQTQKPELPYFLQLAVLSMRFSRAQWHEHVERTSKKLKMSLPDSQAFLLNPTMRFALTGGVKESWLPPDTSTDRLQDILFERIVAHFGPETVMKSEDVPIIVTRVACALYSMGSLRARDTPLARLADMSGCMHTPETVLQRKTAESITDIELDGIARSLVDEPVDAIGVPIGRSRLEDVIEAMQHAKASALPRFAVLINIIESRLIGIYTRVYGDISGTLSVSEIPTELLHLLQSNSASNAMDTAGALYPTLMAIASGPVEPKSNNIDPEEKTSDGDTQAYAAGKIRAGHLRRAVSRIRDGIMRWVLLEQQQQLQQRQNSKRKQRNQQQKQQQQPILLARIARSLVKHVPHVQTIMALTALFLEDKKSFTKVKNMYTFLSMMQEALRPKYQILAAKSKYSDITVKQFSISDIIFTSSTSTMSDARRSESSGSTYDFLKMMMASK